MWALHGHQVCYWDGARYSRDFGCCGHHERDGAVQEVSGSGYPTLPYFADGALQYDCGCYGYSVKAEDIVNFMKSPNEPLPPGKEWMKEQSAVSGCGFLLLTGCVVSR